MSEAEHIAEGLTETQRELLPHLSPVPKETSDLPKAVRQYPRYRDARLISQTKGGGYRFYALTPLGVAVRAALKEPGA